MGHRLAEKAGRYIPLFGQYSLRLFQAVKKKSIGLVNWGQTTVTKCWLWYARYINTTSLCTTPTLGAKRWNILYPLMRRPQQRDLQKKYNGLRVRINLTTVGAHSGTFSERIFLSFASAQEGGDIPRLEF